MGKSDDAGVERDEVPQGVSGAVFHVAYDGGAHGSSGDSQLVGAPCERGHGDKREASGAVQGLDQGDGFLEALCGRGANVYLVGLSVL